MCQRVVIRKQKENYCELTIAIKYRISLATSVTITWENSLRTFRNYILFSTYVLLIFYERFDDAWYWGATANRFSHVVFFLFCFYFLLTCSFPRWNINLKFIHDRQVIQPRSVTPLYVYSSHLSFRKYNYFSQLDLWIWVNDSTDHHSVNKS